MSAANDKFAAQIPLDALDSVEDAKVFLEALSATFHGWEIAADELDGSELKSAFGFFCSQCAEAADKLVIKKALIGGIKRY